MRSNVNEAKTTLDTEKASSCIREEFVDFFTSMCLHTFYVWLIPHAEAWQCSITELNLFVQELCKSNIDRLHLKIPKVKIGSQGL